MKRLLASQNGYNTYLRSAANSTSSVLFRLKSSGKFFLFFFLAFITLNLQAQTNNSQQQAEYKKVITERSSKIINTLELTDTDKYNKIVNEVANQYYQLNTIHEQYNALIADVKKQSLPKEELNAAINVQEEKKSRELLQLHQQFISRLKQQLTEEQVEKIKDGMTYRILPITYAAYQDMLPQLTTEQKEKIYSYLKEARELAMDAESSEKKHGVFGKYKGKINNYLSAAGYDMKKEGEEWQKRIKERNAAKKSS